MPAKTTITLECDSCGLTTVLEDGRAVARIVPDGWFEDEKGGLHCPRHKPTVVAVDVPPDEAEEAALAEDRRVELVRQRELAEKLRTAEASKRAS